MAETQGPAGAGDPFASDLTFEERLQVLEATGAEPGSVRRGAEQRLADQGERLDALAAEVAGLRERLRDQEKALVERIADVDDDRRLTSQQLQRGWQVQREELRSRLRRQGRLTALVGVLVLMGLVIATWYAHARGGPAALSAEVASLRQDIQRLAGLARQDNELDQRLAVLAATVDALSVRPQADPPPAAAPAAALTGLAEQVESLAGEQRRQRAELDGLQRTLQGLVATLQSRTDGEGAVPAGLPPPRDPAGREPEGTAAPPPVSRTPAATAPDPAASAAAAGAPRAGRTQVGDRPFAVQVLGSYDRAAALAAANREGLPETLYLYQGTWRGRPWFVLIYNLYRDRSEAREVLATLPDGLKRFSPSVRELPRGTALEVVERRR